MIPLTLPPEDRRARVQSLWLVLGVTTALAGLLMAVWLRMPEVAVVGAALGGAAALMPSGNPDFARRVYGAWNRRLVEPFARLALRGALTVCFAVIAVAARAGRSRMAVDRAPVAGSSWIPRRSLAPAEYRQPFVGGGAAARTWLVSYAAWSRRTGNRWAISLVPFLLLLRYLAPHEERVVESNIYTLF